MYRYETTSEVVQAGFLLFGVFFVSRDLEVYCHATLRNRYGEVPYETNFILFFEVFVLFLRCRQVCRLMCGYVTVCAAAGGECSARHQNAAHRKARPRAYRSLRTANHGMTLFMPRWRSYCLCRQHIVCSGITCR